MRNYHEVSVFSVKIMQTIGIWRFNFEHFGYQTSVFLEFFDVALEWFGKC